MSPVYIFLSGAVAFGFAVAAMLFLRAWQRTRDRLFSAFGAAFFLLAANQLAVTFGNLETDQQAWVFLLRLAAFTLLIVAIAAKNMGWRGP